MSTVLVLVGLLVALILLGVPIAFSIGTVGTIGLTMAVGDRTLDVFSTFTSQVTQGFTLAAIPLFLLMGEFIYRSGVAQQVFVGMSSVVRIFPGRLAQANIVTSALFAATSGSSVASAAAIAPMSYKEEVVDRGYNRPLVLGSLAAGGTLGILIPPSGILIIYGVATSQSITALFAAGLIPGILLALAYCVYIGARATLNPELLGAGEEEDRLRLNELLRGMAVGFLQTWPLVLVATIVLGLLYGGIATPTETAALGALAAAAVGASKGKLTKQILMDIMMSTARVTAMIFLLIITAQALTLVLSYYGVPAVMREVGTSVDPHWLLILICVSYLFLGLLFDGISIMVLTLPVIIPLLQAGGYDLIWFGVIAVILIEMGLLTPPVGLNLFVVQGSTGADLMEVIRGSLPFVVVQGLCLVGFILVPEVVLWLPNALAS